MVSSKIVSGSHALPPRWRPQCSCIVIESSFDPGERLQAPGSLWLEFGMFKGHYYRFLTSSIFKKSVGGRLIFLYDGSMIALIHVICQGNTLIICMSLEDRWMFLYHVKRMAPFLYHKSWNDINCWVNGPFLESQSRNDYIYMYFSRCNDLFLYHESRNGNICKASGPFSLSQELEWLYLSGGMAYFFIRELYIGLAISMRWMALFLYHASRNDKFTQYLLGKWLYSCTSRVIGPVSISRE